MPRKWAWEKFIEQIQDSERISEYIDEITVRKTFGKCIRRNCLELLGQSLFATENFSKVEVAIGIGWVHVALQQNGRTNHAQHLLESFTQTVEHPTRRAPKHGTSNGEAPKSKWALGLNILVKTIQAARTK